MKRMAWRLYISCFFLLRGLANLLISLFILELLSWVLVIIIEASLALKYLLIQRVFLFVGALGVFLKVRPILTLAILIKMGLPPFHLWFITLLSFFKKRLFFVILTFHKLLPVVLISKIMPLSFTRRAIQLLLLTRGVFILQVRGVFSVFLVSSIIHSGWLILRRVISLSLGLFYWSCYSALVFLFLVSIRSRRVKLTDLNQTSYRSLLWLTMSGIPPFTVFWLKLRIFFYLKFYCFIKWNISFSKTISKVIKSGTLRQNQWTPP